MHNGNRPIKAGTQRPRESRGDNQAKAPISKPKARQEPDCVLCGAAPRTWIWQPAGPSDNLQCVFAFPGEHIRGFPAFNCCDLCHDKIITGETIRLTYRGRRYKVETLNGQYIITEV